MAETKPKPNGSAAEKEVSAQRRNAELPVKVKSLHKSFGKQRVLAGPIRLQESAEYRPSY